MVVFIFVGFASEFTKYLIEARLKGSQKLLSKAPIDKDKY